MVSAAQARSFAKSTRCCRPQVRAFAKSTGGLPAAGTNFCQKYAWFAGPRHEVLPKAPDVAAAQGRSLAKSPHGYRAKVRTFAKSTRGCGRVGAKLCQKSPWLPGKGTKFCQKHLWSRAGRRELLPRVPHGYRPQARSFAKSTSGCWKVGAKLCQKSPWLPAAGTNYCQKHRWLRAGRRELLPREPVAASG